MNMVRQGVGLVTVLFIGLNFTTHAQVRALAATELVAVETAVPDSVARLAAEAKNLPAVSPNQLPRHATYWIVTGEGSFLLPMPFLPNNQSNAPVFSLGSPGQFLVDASDGVVPQPTKRQAARGITAAVLLERQGNAILDLLEQLQAADAKAQQAAELDAVEMSSGKMSTSGGMSRMSLSSAGGSELSSLVSEVDYGTNLWLEIPAVTNGAAYVVLHNVTQGEVYELMTKPALTDPAWLPELALHTVTNQDWIGAPVPMLNRSNTLFFWARDWTGIDANTNSLPDWWEWENFGNLNQTANGDYDADGASNLSEYQNVTDPNTLYFSLSVTNEYVRINPLPLQIDLRKGIPSSLAVLIDNTNVSGAVWNSYSSSNINVNLGSSDGWHQIWVGLRGRLETPPLWETIRVNYDATPPILTVTNPASSILDTTRVQIQGYCPEPLASAFYDLTNAAGLATNLPMFVPQQFYDTNTSSFTTNYFQCFDVWLTNGVNTLTLHATDRAGNATTTNFVFTVDYSNKTNPPATYIYWPQGGTQIGTSNFTWRGWVGDPASQVVAQMVDTSGATNSFYGRVERTGNFCIENLPLKTGENALILTATDGAGNTFATNITVIKSSTVLTIDSTSWSSASGTISDTNHTIMVNGVPATVYDYGDTKRWSANIQLTLDETKIHVEAIPIGSGAMSFMSFVNAASDSNASSNPSVEAETEIQISPGSVYQTEYHISEHYEVPFDQWPGGVGDTRWDWGEQTGGSGELRHFSDWDQINDQYVWLPGRYPAYGQGIKNGNTNLYWGVPVVSDCREHCDATSYRPDGLGTWRRHTESEVKLLSGTEAGYTDPELFLISVGIGADIDPPYNLAFGNRLSIPLPQQVAVGSLGNLDTDGYAATKLPPRAEIKVTPTLKGKKQYWYTVNGQKYKLVSECVATTPANRARTTIGVGEQVTVKFSPDLPINANWSTTGGGISTNLAKEITFTAPNNATNVTITATVKGQACRMNFNVLEPTGIVRAQITGTNSYPLGAAGAGMVNVLWIGPTNVSFYRVNVMEVGEDASNIWGFFSQWTPQQLHHSTADKWTLLTSDNRFGDNAAIHNGGYLTWAAGGYEWNIPQRWQVVGSGVTNSIAGCNEVFSIDSNGTTIVTKYGNWIQRTTNNIITTN